jgi:MraZ protein
MTIFGGTYHHNLDAKGRLNIPAQLRKMISAQANNQLWITRGLKDGCLFVYPNDNWLRKMEELNALPRTEENRNAIRIFSAESFPVEIDSQGRIVVPAQFQKQANLIKEVVIAGVMDKIELWNPSAYEKFLGDNSDNYQELVKQL